MDKPFGRFTGQILPNMPDIVQVIKALTQALVWPTLILSTDTFDSCLSVPMITLFCNLSFLIHAGTLRTLYIFDLSYSCSLTGVVISRIKQYIKLSIVRIGMNGWQMKFQNKRGPKHEPYGTP